LLLALAGAAAWFLGRPIYHGYKERRSLARAQAFAAKGDVRNALLSARQTLAVNPTNVAACRLLAELIGAARLPTEVDWRRRVTELEPTLTNRLALISAALRRQPPPYPIAAEAVAAAAALGSNSIAYHCLAAELALKLKQPELAETHFRRAVQLDPTNSAYQLNTAVLQLASTNVAVVDEARATLERLGARTNLGAVALNWLVGDALRRSNLVEAVACSQRLVAHPAAVTRDQVQHLELLRQAHDPGLPEFLEALKVRAGARAADAFEVSGWMAEHSQAEAALAWWRSLPPNVQMQPPGPLAIADCLLAMQEWPEVKEFLKEPPWGENEFLRQAILARAGWRLQEDTSADTCWRSAAQSARDRMGALTALLALARSWGRTAEEADLLWTIAARFPRERWVLRDLNGLYQRTGNTRGLNKVYAAALAYEGTNFVLRNNFIASSLLLNQSSAETHEAAQALRRERPTDPVVATTYAFSLHKLGKTPEGLAALEQLPPDQLRWPSVALYYAVLLAESGRTNEAKPFAVLARTQALLPEEKALLAKLSLSPADK
jgi:predicted Zn-dependent protease